MRADSSGRAPWWFVLIIVAIAFATAFAIPAANRVMAEAYGDSATIGWLFPAYIVISGICACACYSDRRTVAWILVALMALSDLMLLLC